METKRCSKCGRILPLTDFFQCKSRKDGVQSFCKECHKLANKESKAKRLDEKLKKVYSNPDLAKYTPRELMAELKTRGYTWDYMLEPRREIPFNKI
jgi:hypothetical protein